MSATGSNAEEQKKKDEATGFSNDATQPSTLKSTAADWIATASDDEYATFNVGPRQRGGRKKRKKNQGPSEVPQNWDDIYDPTRPNIYEEYKNSEEKIAEVREWKDMLYRRRIKKRYSSDSDSDNSDIRNRNRKTLHGRTQHQSTDITSERFAPPSMSFAPPPNIKDDIPPPPPPVHVPDDATGEDAYARRMRLSQQQAAPTAPPPPPTSAPPAGQILRAPVRYSLPAPPPELPKEEPEMTAVESTADEPQTRSNRPGQAGFAERLLTKYGWSKGQGLGAQGTGIINPLYAKADKRKKKSDAEGGGFVTPASTGRILGGSKSKAAQAEEASGGKFGAMSEVVRLERMLEGIDLDTELNAEEGGIMQEIGEECGEKYGSVERVFVYRPEDENEAAMVFVQFVSQLSALRAVNALEGRIFNGNAIIAKFWDKEKFERGEYT